ncbi:MAG: alcohol dehydrogenase catalytic domain-containing protein [Anaerolineales bacterium]|nr:alcohol dehydrogenase catalytic domain-containing protein [Anaerolineales bacterium]
MKAGILYNDKDIRVGEASEPKIEPDEVLIQPAFTGICGTDLHVFLGEFHNRVRYPAILGHEFGGTIVDVGADVQGFKAGDRVVVDPIISCHSCPACLTSHINACSTLKLLGIDMDGGLGQYVAAPASHLFQLPESIPMQYAPMVEMFGLGHHILQRGQVQPGETVVILGAGKLGLSILDVLCHSVTPGLTIITDLQPFRLETAKKLGANYAFNIREIDPVEQVLALTDGIGADCVIEAVGHYHLPPGQEAPLAQAVKMIRSGGRIVTAGLGEQLSALHFKTLVLKEAQIIASRVTRGEFPRAIRMLANGLLHPELLVTDQVPLAEITAAFDQVSQEDPETIKVVLDIQQV